MLIRIKQIEDIDLRLEILIFIASLQVDQGGRLRTHTIVLHEWPWAEIAGAETAEYAVGQIDRGARGNCCLNGTWNMVASGIISGKFRVGVGYVEIQGQPGQWFIKIGPLHSVPITGPARLGDPGITYEEEFGVQMQIPERQGRVQTGNPGTAHADFGAFGPYQGVHLQGWITRFWINRDRGASRIVAVEPKATIEIQLRTGPGAEN